MWECFVPYPVFWIGHPVISNVGENLDTTTAESLPRVAELKTEMKSLGNNHIVSGKELAWFSCARCGMWRVLVVMVHKQHACTTLFQSTQRAQKLRSGYQTKRRFPLQYCSFHCSTTVFGWSST